MIQRIQSLLLLLSACSLIIIVFYFPVLKSDELEIYLNENILIAQLSILLSVGVSVFSIFQFKNMKRQLILNQLSKLFISIAFIIIIFQREESSFANGLFLFIVPYAFLVLANIFIKKDDKLVRSSDRIR
ncbi:uncharacterized protein METZ01_LOCUS489747, partial [marine metagenome]